jgi:hypothetical protein
LAAAVGGALSLLLLLLLFFVSLLPPLLFLPTVEFSRCSVGALLPEVLLLLFLSEVPEAADAVVEVVLEEAAAASTAEC